MCHAKEESSIHFMMDCFLYTAERQTLFDLVKHYIPNFSILKRNAKVQLLLNGIKVNEPDYNHLNTIITNAVQTFIIQTK